MLNTALLSRMSQKSQHTRYEEIILGRICCEEALQVMSAWKQIQEKKAFFRAKDTEDDKCKTKNAFSI